jgi:PAS domain S-box-containing protein
MNVVAATKDRQLSEQTIRLAVEACPSGMIMIDAAGNIVLINTEAERLFGYEREELLGQSVDMLVPAGLRPAHVMHRDAFVGRPATRRMGVGRDLYGLRKDGTQIPVEIGLNPISTRDGFFVLSAVTDLTERKAAEERFRRVVEGSPIAKIMTDGRGTIVLVNVQAERLFGYQREELVGKPVEILVPPRIRGVHTDFRDAFLAHPEVRSMGQGRDLFLVRKDGSELPVEIGLNPIAMPEGRMVLCAVVDISERKKALERLAEQREELQRSNADLEQFAYVASHDLQEPLRMVSTYAELLAERYRGKLDDKADKYIGYCMEGAQRMQQLVKDLLAYSRVGSNAGIPIVVQPEVIIANVLAGLRVSIEESRAEIVRENLPAVRADQTQLAQVFQNLIGNALKFRGERPPRIHIRGEKGRPMCKFSVEDNGIGIDRQHADRAFQMFQRLHERGRYQGNGIGLAISKKIVERHGGRIWFESEPDKGTTFHFTMPGA